MREAAECFETWQHNATCGLRHFEGFMLLCGLLDFAAFRKGDSGRLYCETLMRTCLAQSVLAPALRCLVLRIRLASLEELQAATVQGAILGGQV